MTLLIDLIMILYDLIKCSSDKHNDLNIYDFSERYNLEII